jgi:hypothetical protein
MGKWLLAYDGPDPRMRPGMGTVSSTGRVGHITALRFDTLSRTYAGESKQVIVPAKLWKWWILINEVSFQNGKKPLIRIEPTNASPTHVNGKLIPYLHIITEERHRELLEAERRLLDIEGEQPQQDVEIKAYTKQQQLARKRK